MKTVPINRPDDWHVHFREGELLKHTVPATAMHFSRALVMPNLPRPLTTIAAINRYREEIIATTTKDSTFFPYMTFYLNESIPLDELGKATIYPYILGAKLYPSGATTNSEAGPKSLGALYPLLDCMQQLDLVLQIHGEVTHSDIFKREALFIDACLKPIITNFPKLRVVLEHISSKAAVDFVTEAPATLAATITPHHLAYNRNHLLAGGIKPHYYCLPILKQARDQKALQRAAISGNPKFFAGTDSAPHDVTAKESACGCAGIFSAPFALPLYAEIFEQLGKLDRLNHFMSHYGAGFYQLPINQDSVELIKKRQIVPTTLLLGLNTVVPIAAGEALAWSVHA